MRPFFRTILVQEEARAAELAAAAHPSAPSPPPLSRASAMPSPPSSHQLMMNQSFVPLTMVTSGSTLDQRQAQSLVSDEIGAASFASWQQLSKDSMNLAKGETHSDAFFAKQKLGKNEWAQDTIPQRCLFSSFFFVLFLVCIPMKRSLHPHEKDSSPFATPFFLTSLLSSLLDCFSTTTTKNIFSPQGELKCICKLILRSTNFHFFQYPSHVVAHFHSVFFVFFPLLSLAPLLLYQIWLAPRSHK
ncbi:transmembrane protein, putative [Bodo saltans]|uniref:Transmembrane protein, putative n=1 Tax=Bodo saltans TaxID=75058 RepID=A0A0S4J286_BODSA|nr:transmembrane protein, putative [Bodo saltans]|eukprot:CUG60318.1 transmembrane protein, putative [Bodo saltans]